MADFETDFGGQYLRLVADEYMPITVEDVPTKPIEDTYDWIIRPTAIEAMDKIKLQKADQEFARFDSFGETHGVKVIPFRREGLDDTSVPWIEEGYGLTSLIKHLPHVGLEAFAGVVSTLSQYLENSIEVKTDFVLCDLAKPSQYVLADEKIWLVDIEPRVTEANHVTYKAIIDQITKYSQCLLSSLSPRCINALDDLQKLRHRNDL